MWKNFCKPKYQHGLIFTKFVIHVFPTITGTCVCFTARGKIDWLIKKGCKTMLKKGILSAVLFVSIYIGSNLTSLLAADATSDYSTMSGYITSGGTIQLSGSSQTLSLNGQNSLTATQDVNLSAVPGTTQTFQRSMDSSEAMLTIGTNDPILLGEGIVFQMVDGAARTGTDVRGGAVTSNQTGSSISIGATFHGNRINATNASGAASAYGGGLYTTGTISEITQLARFIDNHVVAESTSGNANAYGGGVRANVINTIDGTIQNNSISAIGILATEARGGGVVANSNMGTVGSDALITGNRVNATSDSGTASVYGGGLYTNGDITEIQSGATISNNHVVAESTSGSANAYGGGVRANIIDTIDGTIQNNSISAIGISADARGGGVVANSSMGTVGSDALVTGNRVNATSDSGLAFANGGGLYTNGTLDEIRSGATISNNHVVAESTSGNAVALGGGVLASGDMEIGAATFVGNSITAVGAGNSIAHGGAIFLSTTGGNGTLSLDPGSGTLLIRGNMADGVANGIHIGALVDSFTGDYLNSNNDAQINVDGSGGLVAMYDPVSIYQNNNNDFIFTKSNNGSLLWGGENVFTAEIGSNSTTTMTFKGGTTTLLANYTACVDGGMQFDALKFDGSSTTIKPILNGRDNSIAAFQSPTNLDVTGSPELAPQYLNLDINAPVDQQWLFISDGNSNDFNVIDSKGVDFSVENDSDGLWIKADATQQLTNVRNAFGVAGANAEAASPAIAQVFNMLDPDLQDTLSTNFLTNPGLLPSLTGESILNQGNLALKQSRFLRFAAMEQGLFQEEDRTNYGLFRGQCKEPNRKPRAWFSYIGGDFDMDNHGRYYGYDSRIDAGSIGLSRNFSQGTTSGVFFTFGQAQNDFDSLLSRIESDVFQFGAFHEIRFRDCWRMNFQGSYSHFDNNVERFSGGVFPHSGSFDQDVYGFGTELSRDFGTLRCGRLTPFFGIDWEHLEQSSYIDSSGPFGLVVKGTDGDSIQSRLGARWSQEWLGSLLSPELLVAWRHEYGDTRISSSSFFASNSGVIAPVRSYAEDRDVFDVGMNLKSQIFHRWGIHVFGNTGYLASLSPNGTDQNWFAGVELRR